MSYKINQNAQIAALRLVRVRFDDYAEDEGSHLVSLTHRLVLVSGEFDVDDSVPGCIINLDREAEIYKLAGQAPGSTMRPEWAQVLAWLDLQFPAALPAELATSPSMQSARQLTYRFLQLPHVARVDVANVLGLRDRGDEKLTDNEQYVLIFQRAKQANLLDTLRTAVEERLRELKR